MENYKNLYDNSPIALFQMSLEGNFLIVNNKTLKILGFNSLDELNQHPKFNEKQFEIFKNEITKDQNVEDFLLDFYKKNKTKITLLITAKLDQEGKLVEGTMRDITDLIEFCSLGYHLDKMSELKKEVIDTIIKADQFHPLLRKIVKIV